MDVYPKGPIGSLPGPARRALWSLARRNQLSRGDILFLGGQDDDGWIYLVRRGMLRLTQRGTDGREVTVDIGSPGDLLGLKPPLLGGTNDHDAVAVTDSVVYSFPAKVTIDALLSDPSGARALAASICSMHRRSYALAVERATGSVQARLASRLLHLARLAGSGSDPAEINGRIAHGDLGLLIGASRERTCVEMINLRRAGIIDYGIRGLRIFRPDVLERLRCGGRVAGPSRSTTGAGRQRSLSRSGT